MSAPKPVLARDFLALVRPPSFFSRSLVKASGCARSASPLPPRRRCRVVLTATGPAGHAGPQQQCMESASVTPAPVPATANSTSRQSRTGQVANPRARPRPGRGRSSFVMALSGGEQAPQVCSASSGQDFGKLPRIVMRRGESRKPLSLGSSLGPPARSPSSPALCLPGFPSSTHCKCDLPSY